MLDSYLALETAEEQQIFIARIAKQYPRLAHWFVPLARESRTTVSLFKHSPAPLASDLLNDHASPPTPDLEPGTRLGPWQINAYVGAGGMGKVYCGERADGTFEMDVAIKLIGSQRSALAESLRHECQLLARLDHPGVTRLIDAGLTDEDEPYLVMEWIEGLDLEQWLEDSKPTLSRRLALFETLVEATAHAHQRLIVHGDIKPANVRLRDDGTVKLMDFGVAQLMGSSRTDEQGVRALTPAFAAPELLDGNEITPASDIWALGALLCWLLTGQTRAISGDDVCAKVAAAGHSRSRELGAMIDKACNEQQHLRYRSASELLADLQACGEHRPISVLSHDRPYRARQFIRRNPVLVGGTVATASALVIGLVATLIMYQQAGQERDRAERHATELAQVVGFQEAQLAGIDAETMGADMRSSLRKSLIDAEWAPSDPEALSGHWPQMLDGLLSTVNFTNFALESLDLAIFEHSRQAIHEQFAKQPVVQAKLLQTLATTLRNVGLVHQSIEPQSTALEIRRRELGRAHPDTQESMRELHHLQRIRGQYAESVATLEELLELQLPTKGELHRSTLLSINSLGSMYFHLGDLDKARQFYDRALEGRLEALGEWDGDTAFTMTGLGALYRELGKYEESETMLRRALEIVLEVHDETHFRTLNTLRQLARLMVTQDRPEQAERYFLQVLDIERKGLGNQHPETLHTLRNLGQFQARAGNTQEAEKYLKEALNGYQVVLGEDHPLTRETRNSLSDL